ncbi:fam-h protein [Plasmodium relictum]|uniref:Fam-h protein n=1 Tax=Plasmodium relictum TaxID=85471 RepID=A0A1J1GNX3_PLARL|nr:fam-h protein [Plasmodium relictum]CRG84767.1 fam-h protein [Plasmodium relictum]
MNRKKNIDLIFNFRMHSRYYSHVTKGFNDTYIPALNIYSKRKKKNALYFPIKFFIFTLSIWILQYSNNWDSCKSLNHKNGLNNILNLGDKRSLAENNDSIKQKEGLQCYIQEGMMTINLEPRNEQSKIEQNINVEPKYEKETMEKNEKIKFSEGILYKCKNNLKLVSLFLAIFLSLSSFSLFLLNHLDYSELYDVDLVLFTLSSLIVSTILIYERIDIKYKK